MDNLMNNASIAIVVVGTIAMVVEGTKILKRRYTNSTLVEKDVEEEVSDTKKSEDIAFLEKHFPSFCIEFSRNLIINNIVALRGDRIAFSYKDYGHISGDFVGLRPSDELAYKMYGEYICVLTQNGMFSAPVKDIDMDTLNVYKKN